MSSHLGPARQSEEPGLEALLAQQQAESAWQHALAVLRRMGCRYRLYSHPRSPYIWVRRAAPGLREERFSLAPLQRHNARDIGLALQQCERNHVLGHWPREQTRAGLSWRQLALAVARRVEGSIVKEGSRVHLLNDLKRRVALLRDPPSAEGLEAWVLELDPLTQRRSYQRRLEVVSQIERSQLLELGDLLERLRRRRPRGAAVRLQQAQQSRVRVVPSDGQVEAWLDGLAPFDRWVYGVLATYGLRPHELWHAEAPDGRGWVTVPGGMVTKSARAHFAPPVPERWLSRYGLARDWQQQQQALRRRWPIRWEQHGGVAVAVNNAALGQYLYKQFTLRGVPRLVAPLASGDGEDWARPYDLRHAYAIRCAISPETVMVEPERQAAWLGHSAEVHRRIYLRWLPAERARAAEQEKLEQQRGDLSASEREELEELRRQLAAVQELLGRRD